MNLQVFIFIPHPALLDPLSAWASSPPPPLDRVRTEPCLPMHLAVRQYLWNKEEMAKNEKIQFSSGAASGSLCLTHFSCFPLTGSGCLMEVRGKGREQGRGVLGGCWPVTD